MDHKVLASKKQNIFFQNLLALGFDVTSMEKDYKLKFDRKMFSLPNQKAFEVVTHFLFTKLNEISQKKYVLLWPLLDVQAHRQFQKTCFSYLSSIAQESTVKFPLISTLVLSSYGESFYDLYFAFSTHVVIETNKKYSSPMLVRPRIANRFHEKSVELLKCSTIACVNKFVELVEISKHNLYNYLKCANDLTTCINNLKMSNSAMQSSFSDQIREGCRLFCINNSLAEKEILENMVKENTVCLLKVEQYKKLINEFFLKEEKLWNCVSSELNEDCSKPVLKRNSFINPIPDVIHNEQSEETDNCIIKHLKIFLNALDFYMKSIKKGVFLETPLYNSLNEVSDLEKCIKNLKSLNTELQDNNSVNKSSIQKLMKYLDEPVENVMKMQSDLPPNSNIFSSSVDKEQESDRVELFITSLRSLKDTKEHQNESSTMEEGYNSYHESDSKNNIFQDFEFLASNSDNSQISDLQQIHGTVNPIERNIEAISTFTEKLPNEDLEICQETINKNQDLIQHEEPPFDSSSSSSFIPESWLLEESLNSQSLYEHPSFLD